MRKLKLLQSIVAYFATRASPAESAEISAATRASTRGRGAPSGAAVGWLSRATWLFPMAMASAALAYLIAALLYPGGSYAHQGAESYDVIHNYFCDLTARHPHGHSENPARPFGVAALWSLNVALLLNAFTVQTLVPYSPAIRRSTLALFSVGAVSGSLVFTPLHDRAIWVGFIPSAVAFLLSLSALLRAGYLRLAWLGLWPLFAGSLCFALWAQRWALQALPGLQKLAIIALMIWMLIASGVAGVRDGSSRP